MKKFSTPPTAIVVTSTFVTHDEMPILEVSHDDDEEGGSLWQFHCGNGDYGMDKVQLVRLDTILAIDPAINHLADLEVGKTARRDTKDSPWIVAG